MNDIDIRVKQRAGRITLQRPNALNAMTYDMCTAIEQALLAWRENDTVDLIVIDALGDRAFCAGGDIANLYDTGKARNFKFGQRFWADEYRLNALISDYPKPYVALMQGFTMGGGVGISCHGSHRIVGESSQISMPECGIGLVPDVGGSDILARAPGHLGAYLGLTAQRMGPSDAIYVGFADNFILQHNWTKLTQDLEKTGNIEILESYYQVPPDGRLKAQIDTINRFFDTPILADIATRLMDDKSEFAQQTIKAMRRNSPLSMACALHIIDHNRGSSGGLHEALNWEYRFTARSMEFGDFIEGIRAAIIDKDRNPNWKHAITGVPTDAIERMLAPLGKNELRLQGE
ncbi:MAG: enoyl-CoA hydratase/isomerase family protein [Paracoccaceae bacterium]|nr:enoyl-CoA hydratase/isomerase family protein [Paracoccaceae bacterium]